MRGAHLGKGEGRDASDDRKDAAGREDGVHGGREGRHMQARDFKKEIPHVRSRRAEAFRRRGLSLRQEHMHGDRREKRESRFLDVRLKIDVRLAP